MKSTVAQSPVKSILIASVIAAAAAASMPGLAATTTASATANVMVPITITKATDLSFGSFVAGPGGTITISTSGARTATGPTLGGGTPGAATFTIGGEPNTLYTIDTTGTTANLTNGANNMGLSLVTDLTGAGATTGTAATGTLSGAGAQTLYVGGVLTVGASQVAGSYSGTVSVAVNYQ